MTMDNVPAFVNDDIYPTDGYDYDKEYKNYRIWYGQIATRKYNNMLRDGASHEDIMAWIKSVELPEIRHNLIRLYDSTFADKRREARRNSIVKKIQARLGANGPEYDGMIDRDTY